MGILYIRNVSYARKLSKALCLLLRHLAFSNLFLQSDSKDMGQTSRLDFTTTSKSHSDFSRYLIPDNARPHGAVVTQQLLGQIKWDVSYHSTYSPDIATSDYYLFPELKNWIGGQSFQTNQKIQSNVKAHLTQLAAMFFEEGI
ncbi:hypothetical protein AVEN_33093-1 [Araneus ventricosus]|uniref:Histone-lysine N-methyltransferase SETMAR n=1 Tax=Araneus ventricosus TaxID=182803 RepID=A0A4Y2CV45_ARAVE|nr:hypothetical protein AVEN_33093-1 [Araneus ventricosus]